MYGEPNPLVGKTLKEIKVADDKKALLFVTDQGEVVARAYGDCCSSTWVEDISLPALGLPALVTSVDDLELPDPPQQPEYDVVVAYGCKISTDRGEVIIEYRNESNGYYGGSLEWDESGFYDGVFGQNKSSMNWVAVA